MDPQTMTVAAGSTVTFTWSSTHNVYEVPDATALDNCDWSSGTLVASSSVQTVDVAAPDTPMTKYYVCAETGRCKWFDCEKGYGFISVDGEDRDYFVHQSDIYAPGYRSLAQGETLEFSVATDERTGKIKAVEVTGPDGQYVEGTPPPEFDDDEY